MRWRLRLQELDFEPVHRPGIKHQAPDALSRLATDGHDSTNLDFDISVVEITEREPTGLEALKILCEDTLDMDTLRKEDIIGHQTEDEPIRFSDFKAEQENDPNYKTFRESVG